jgi:hypothetical protein
VRSVESYFPGTEHQAQIQRHYRRNIVVSILDFGFHSCGMSFAPIVTVLPL